MSPIPSACEAGAGLPCPLVRTELIPNFGYHGVIAPGVDGMPEAVAPAKPADATPSVISALPPPQVAVVTMPSPVQETVVRPIKMQPPTGPHSGPAIAGAPDVSKPADMWPAIAVLPPLPPPPVAAPAMTAAVRPSPVPRPSAIAAPALIAPEPPWGLRLIASTPPFVNGISPLPEAARVSSAQLLPQPESNGREPPSAPARKTAPLPPSKAKAKPKPEREAAPRSKPRPAPPPTTSQSDWEATAHKIRN